MKVNIFAPVLAVACLAQAVTTAARQPGGLVQRQRHSQRNLLDHQFDPVSFTCFNVGDIFSRSNTSAGFQNGLANCHDDGDQRNGVAWLLQNQHLYDATANYSRVWYAQANTSKVEPGKAGSWVFYTYALPDCEQLAQGRLSRPDDHPWYETSCQTDEDGQCRSTPGPIISFGINTAAA